MSDRMPFSIRVLLESAVRCCDGLLVLEKDVNNILNWDKNQHEGLEIPFLPSRVILQDLTGTAAIVDFAAMRDAFKKLGGNPEKVNPLCPTDLVVDHSVQVDYSRVYVNVYCFLCSFSYYSFHPNRTSSFVSRSFFSVVE